MILHRYQLVPMTREHLDEVLAIEQESYDSPWEQNAFETELGANPVSWSRVALTADPEARVAGYCIAWNVLDHLQIQNLAVHPAHRRRGLGRRLLVEAIEEGRARGATEALLEVRRSNDAAQRLYRTLGFVETGIRRAYYSRPVEDALLFRKELLPMPGSA
jgi:ribosomal-protein-alanine N-acetyltransferase